jgi:hypothetical protein
MGSALGGFAGQFGKSYITMAWKDEGNFRRNMNNGELQVNSKLNALLQYYAPEVENWMKSNAPWTDRTGNARNGLAARAYQDKDGHGIILYHQVPYGIWLEIRFNGEYAIIGPALQYWGPLVMSGVKDMLTQIGG